jgi:hypothetical protein
MSALRAAVQLVLALHDKPESPEELEHNWIVRLDPMAEAQLRRALETSEFPWDEENIEVYLTWSHPHPDGRGHNMGSGGETTEHLSPAGLINLITKGRRDEDGLDVTSVHIFTAVPKPVNPEAEPRLRALQHAANGLNYHEFCDALGWDRNDYSKAKFVEFQGLGRLGVFDSSVLSRLIEYHQGMEARRGAHTPA